MKRLPITAAFIGGAICAGVSVWAQARPAPAVTASGVGVTQPRYQIVISPHVRADTFLLDTATGRIWQQGEYTDIQGEPTVWEIKDRIDDPAAFAAWLARHKVK